MVDCGLSHANLSGAVLRDVDLRYSTAKQTVLDGADLRDANLEQVDFRGTDLRRAILDPDSVLLVVMDDTTLLPKGIERSKIAEPARGWSGGMDLPAWLERCAELP